VTPNAPTSTAVPAVGPREPCPCGSGKRYKNCHGRDRERAAAELVERPFAGLANEPDWVALRELVPSATATVRTVEAHGARDVVVCTLLPQMLPALHRADGTILLALQTTTHSGDASRDLAAALLDAIEREPGTAVGPLVLPGPGPRLQDVLDPAVPLEPTVHEDFGYWVADDAAPSADVTASLTEAAASIVPTVRLTDVPAAYWVQMGRAFLRWARPEPQENLLDAFARLHARRAAALTPGSRFVGAFRSCGLLVPVWELAEGTQADDVEGPAREFDARLAEALTATTPLTADERRARAGLVSRQVTLR
jgi:hypothetical protein